jgi:molybdopterin synthase catalytic subunit
MSIDDLLVQIKQHPRFHDAGMVLCHNGVVRGTSRDGRPVRGLRVAVDHHKLDRVLSEQKKRAGIIDILVEICADTDLKVGDDVMYIVVAGDIRENVIASLTDTLNAIKTTVTQKTEYFTQE